MSRNGEMKLQILFSTEKASNKKERDRSDLRAYSDPQDSTES